MNITNTAHNTKLKDIVNSLLSANEMTDDILLALYAIYDKTLSESLQIIDKQMIVKYIFKPSNRSFYVVNGHQKDSKYLCLLDGDYCGCPAFRNSSPKSDFSYCKHQLASKLTEMMNDKSVTTLSDRLQITV
ncbi:hypothetical protein PPL_01746 [Heterostelium album PN500]|uniref:SWIM-type domain-containing protein n=1 Tax=Heterostelium pallidum (strain ATCC 26659 / Pp 5 / PN500) TaxID=670386 RepID=D3B0D0_HETP5|nr:hypothetical protein PPL_01746 [Heterostelium album PN500]EFA84754.1 hypothetical protein PPL_01746 [Heterostelium album PN500]|eukprot:XP_020436866.1 hypothetical protein PPL_01746 [Heterostelium album PN500]